MKLSKHDCALIAEMRTLKIRWKIIAKMYDVDFNKLQQSFYTKMKYGFNKKEYKTIGGGDHGF